MGLKSLKERNKPCLACCVWMLFVGSDSVWNNWVKILLLRGQSFWTVMPNANYSWHWKKLLKLGSLLRPMLKHEIGNGHNTSVA